METARSLYSNILALVSILAIAFIFSGMPLFYGLDATLDIALVLGIISGSLLTVFTRLSRERTLASVRTQALPRLPRQ